MATIWSDAQLTQWSEDAVGQIAVDAISDRDKYKGLYECLLESSAKGDDR